jgi:transcriptional regulator NrdR family protein
MKCPCGGKLKVYETRDGSFNKILRRRVCDICGLKTRTEEKEIVVFEKPPIYGQPIE